MDLKPVDFVPEQRPVKTRCRSVPFTRLELRCNAYWRFLKPPGTLASWRRMVWAVGWFPSELRDVMQHPCNINQIKTIYLNYMWFMFSWERFFWLPQSAESSCKQHNNDLQQAPPWTDSSSRFPWSWVRKKFAENEPAILLLTVKSAKFPAWCTQNSTKQVVLPFQLMSL